MQTKQLIHNNNNHQENSGVESVDDYGREFTVSVATSEKYWTLNDQSL